MRRLDDPKEDRSSDSVFINTTHVVQSVIGLNNGLPFARSEDYPAFVKVCNKLVSSFDQSKAALTCAAALQVPNYHSVSEYEVETLYPARAPPEF